MYGGLSRCLRVIAERVSREQGEQQEYFTVRTLDVMRHIPLKEILYFATAGRTHRIELHARQERLDFIGSIQELEEKLAPQFIRIHRSYLVRADQIDRVQCPFSRNMRQRLLNCVNGSGLPFGQ